MLVAPEVISDLSNYLISNRYQKEISPKKVIAIAMKFSILCLSLSALRNNTRHGDKTGQKEFQRPQMSLLSTEEQNFSCECQFFWRYKKYFKS